MQPLVIYHANCWDGFCAAWLFHRHYPDAEFHAAHYGTAPPNVTGRDVYIVDFSYKRAVMRQIMSLAHFVCVLDHHKTAQAELDGLTDEFCQRPDLIANPPGSELPSIHFDMEKSGARLAWEYLWGKHYAGKYSEKNLDRDRAPWLVNYVEDRDLWRWRLPLSHEINAALRSYPLEFGQWDALARTDPRKGGRLAQEGSAIMRREKQIVEDHVRHAREVEMDGHRVLCVNATTLFSEIAGELAKGHPFGVCWFRRADGKFVFSLRSRSGDGTDVSEIAKKFGGGGHKHAAGFETESIII